MVMKRGTVAQCGCKEQRWSRWTSSSTWGELSVQSNGDCGSQCRKRVQEGWSGWKKVTGVICDRRVPAERTEKRYKTVMRPTRLYDLETVVV